MLFYSWHYTSIRKRDSDVMYKNVQKYTQQITNGYI